VSDRKAPTTGRHVRLGRWRRGHFRKIDDSSRGDVTGAVPFLGFGGVGFVWLVDALERRRVGAWALAVVFFLGGAWFAAPLFVGGVEGIGSLGWMTWGAVGAMAGAGFWLAAVPYRGRGPAKALRACAVVAALAPVVLHLMGVI
jgi:hypothetical protein